MTRRKLGRLRSPGSNFVLWTQFQSDISSTDFVLKRLLNTLNNPNSQVTPQRKITPGNSNCVVQSGSIGIKYVRLALRRVYPAINKVAPHARLSVISRHFDPRPPIPINTPYSIERLSGSESATQQARRLSSLSHTSEKENMSSQPEHPALLIPGPIEFDDAVLQSMSHFR